MTNRWFTSYNSKKYNRFQSKRMDDQRCSLAEPTTTTAVEPAPAPANLNTNAASKKTNNNNAKPNGIQPNQKEDFLG